MNKKEYLSPELTFVKLRLCDAVCDSVEELETQINQGGFETLPGEGDFDDIID